MVKSKEMEEILRQIGWADGFNIPAISDENRELENEVSALLRQKAELLVSVSELDDLNNSINSHTAQLKVDSAHDESLLTEQQAQLETEGSLIKLLQGEETRLKAAIQQERQVRREIEERCARVEAQIKEHEASAIGAARDTESGQYVRGEWENFQAKANRAAKTLADFYKQDENKLKDLELQRSRLQSEIATVSGELYETAATVNSLEQQLDASARQYRADLNERRALVSRWEASAAGVRSREEASRLVEQETAELRASLNKKLEQLTEVKDFEDDEARNNRELEYKSRTLGQQLSRLKSSLKAQKAFREALHEEIGTLQCQLAGCGSSLSAERSQASELASLVKSRENRHQQLVLACSEKHKRLQMLANLQGGAGERLSRLYAMQEEKKRELAELHKCGEKIDLETTVLRQEAVNVMRAEEALVAGISGEQAALRQLASKRAAVERELERHRDMLLCLELSVQRQQLRISRLTADKPQEVEDLKLADKEKKLHILIQNKQNTRDVLVRELKNIEKSERQMAAATLALSAEVQELRDKERALQATVDGGVLREGEADTRESQERAKLALLQARLSKRREETNHDRNAVLHLRTTALQAERAAKLQSSELAVETSALKAEIAGAEQENAELRAAIAQRKLRLQQLQNVYDITVTTMERVDDVNLKGIDLADGATEYITRQRIRVAQEKGELVQNGNALDTEIRRAEREIRAMEHTLALVKAANDRYRTSLALPGAQASAAQANDPELLAQIESEEKRQQELKNELRRLRNMETCMRETVNKLRVELSAASEEQRSLSVSYAEREHEISETQRELAEQQVKFRRASTQARLMSRELRAENPTQPTFEERDLEVREIRRVTGIALKELWALGEQYVEARPLITRYLQEKGLPLSSQSPQQRRQICPRGLLTSARSSTSGIEQHTAASPALLNIHFPEPASPVGSHQGSKKT